MLRPITHNRRRVLGAAAATLAASGLVLAGTAELRSSTPLSRALLLHLRLIGDGLDRGSAGHPAVALLIAGMSGILLPNSSSQ